MDNLSNFLNEHGEPSIALVMYVIMVREGYITTEEWIDYLNR